MNDVELDRLLNSWETPKPTASLRRSLRGRFPRPERSRLRRFRWGIAIALASITLAVAIGQSPPDSGAVSGFDVLRGWYDSFMYGIELRRLISTLTEIRESNPQVFIDGVPAGPAEPGIARTLVIDVPGEGVYVMTLISGLSGWTKAGYLRGNKIEFDAGRRHVRIELSQRVVDGELPVYVRRQDAL